MTDSLVASPFCAGRACPYNQPLMNELSAALSVLTAMITPAVLISACGSLLLSTSDRLGRSVNRVRELSEKLEGFAKESREGELFEERRANLFRQLDVATSRARILQRCLSVLYLALCAFVMTSVFIAVVSVSVRFQYFWLPVAAGMVGAFLLLYSSLMLIREARLASRGTRIEMDFTWKLSQLHVPTELQETYKPEYLRRNL